MRAIFKRSWITVQYKSQDKWIGIYHENVYGSYLNTRTKEKIGEELHIWICLIPCFPVYIIKGLKPNNLSNK